jgi:Tol biopolymer transport system component
MGGELRHKAARVRKLFLLERVGYSTLNHAKAPLEHEAVNHRPGEYFLGVDKLVCWAVAIALLGWASGAMASSIAPHADASDQFKVYLNDVADSSPFLLFSDPTRQVDHAHVSPDHRWVVFSRFNNYSSNGQALETGDYTNTEIIVCAADGSSCTQLVTPKPGVVAANPEWLEDSDTIIFTNGVKIKSVVRSTGVIGTYFDSTIHPITDPQVVGQYMVVCNMQSGVNDLFIVNLPQQTMTKLTSPSVPSGPGIAYGDYDAKLSPDGTMVAFMRHLPPNLYHTIVLNAANVEVDLSGPNPGDGVPAWSSDGQLLIFWNAAKNTIQTMTPAGADRTTLPLTGATTYQDPDWYPDETQTPARIVYSTAGN